MKRLILRTVLPAFLAIGLFSGVVFFYFLPSLGRAVLDQKRMMIQELTDASWNILARFEAEERASRLTRQQAQAAAIGQIRTLHYGQGGKDYFWVNDMGPRMIVHPYRPDLEGTDLSTFTDRQGKHMFLEMVRVVRRSGAGYVRYMWQWKDDPDRVVPKLSYVKGFEPWGWIIGTGVYTDDVDAEVEATSSQLRGAALLILGIVSLLMFVLLRTSVQAERGRLLAASALRASEEKYRQLVESAGESIFMCIDREHLYANASMLRLVGYSHDEFAKLAIAELLRPTIAEVESGQRRWQAVMDGLAAPTRYEAELVAKGGDTLRVTLSLSRVVLEGKVGFMAVATQLAQPRELDLQAARTMEDLSAANRQMATMASLMMSHGADALQVSRMLSVNADIVVNKAVELAVAELGTPPVAFDIMLMGSMGRSEVSLLADQDHAIIHADVAVGQEAAREYFLSLGAKLSDILDAAGYRYCPGGIMSGNSDCCRSISSWKRTFSAWVNTLKAEDLLQAEIFFDFRSALGEGTLVAELQGHLQSEIHRQPRFVHLMARSVLEYEPPLNAFGGFVLEDAEAVHATFDVKGVLAQIVSFARLRALQHGVAVTSTLERLDELSGLGQLHVQTLRSTTEAFRFLMTLRLQHQAQQLLNILDADNRIEPDALDVQSRARLKTIFTDMKEIQSVMNHEFRGAP